MALPHRDLINACVRTLQSYQGSLLSLEDHLINTLEDQELHEDDHTFITEVFSGCLRYKAVMGAVTKGFYAQHGSTLKKSDEALYTVICYLALFRLEELSVPHFKKFVRTADFNKMHRFLTYITNEAALKTWIKDEWNKSYDSGYVQKDILSPWIRYLPELDDLVKELKEKVEGKSRVKKGVIEPTSTKPFNLTKPRARSVPMPEPIPKLEKHKGIPRTTYLEPQEQDTLAELRVVNRRKAEARLVKASQNLYGCANLEKSEKTKQRIYNLLDEEEKKLKFDSYKARPLPSTMLKTDVPIKMNMATILREGQLFKQREDEVVKKLEKLEAGAQDGSQFFKWQQEMRQKDLDAKLAAIEQRRLLGKLSREEAILVRQNLIDENQRKVEQMKQETKELMSQYLEQRLKEEAHMRDLVEEVASGRETAKEAKEKLRAYKAKIVQEVTDESRELMKLALEEAEEEMRRKVELINQIRAVEAVPINRQKTVDLTQTAGYRFLNEMSIAELRERLSLLKEKAVSEEEEKRSEILTNKQAKDQLLLNTLEVISRHRTEDTRTRAEQEVNKRIPTGKPSSVAKDEKVLELEQRLEQRRAERVAKQKQAKLGKPSKESRAQEWQGRRTEKMKSEEVRWQQLEATKERRARLQSEGVHSSKLAARLTATDGSRLAVASRPFISTYT